MIEISLSPTADTRTCDFTKVTEDTLYLSSQLHINDVQRGLAFFGYLLDNASRRHDFDKLSDIAGFHRDFLTGFKETTWWDRHRKLNRHHLNVADGVPDDVNLIDVLDMIADGVPTVNSRWPRMPLGITSSTWTTPFSVTRFRQRKAPPMSETLYAALVDTKGNNVVVDVTALLADLQAENARLTAARPTPEQIALYVQHVVDEVCRLLDALAPATPPEGPTP